MNDTDKRLNRVENCVEKHQDKIISHDKEFERVIGDIKDLKNDRKEMNETLKSLERVLNKLSTMVEKLELRLEYEEQHTRDKKEFKDWSIKKTILFVLQILGGLMLAGLTITLLGG
jgi:chromosome segregation ATPase